MNEKNEKGILFLSLEPVHACYTTLYALLSSLLIGFDQVELECADGLLPVSTQDLLDQFGTYFKQQSFRFGVEGLLIDITPFAVNGFGIFIVFDGSFAALRSPVVIEKFCDRLFTELNCYYGAAGYLCDENSDMDFCLNPADFADPSMLLYNIGNLYQLNYLNLWHARWAGIDRKDCLLDYFEIRQLPGGFCLAMNSKAFQDECYSCLRTEVDALLSGFAALSTFADTSDEIRSEQSALQQQTQQINRQCETFQQFVDLFEKDYLSVDRAPRNFVWRPFRLCSQDVVLGITVVRHCIENNSLLVAVCLISEIPEFEDYSSAKAMLSFLISEAFKCGGSLEISFRDDNGIIPIPPEIHSLAQNYGIVLSKSEQGVITREEAIELYFNITEMNPVLKHELGELYRENLLDLPRILYAIARGIWNANEVEQIISCLYPNGIFASDIKPEVWFLFSYLLDYASSAVLGGYMDNFVVNSGKNELDGILIEDNQRDIIVEFNPQYNAKVYRFNEDLELPFIISEDDGLSTLSFRTGDILVLLLRVRSVDLIQSFLQVDVDQANEYLQEMRAEYDQRVCKVGILLTRDWDDLSADSRKSLLVYAKERDVLLLKSNETEHSLASEAQRRMEFGKNINQ